MLRNFLVYFILLPFISIHGADSTLSSLGKGFIPSVHRGSSTEDETNCFQRWIRHTISELASNSDIIQTSSGPIEYVMKGSGPIVLCLHGGFGGYDQALLIGDNLIDAGFTVLAPSRPGYLRTPLSVGTTPEQQADAMISLLDALRIEQVQVIGFSAGCSVAFQMALRRPDRVTSLTMECLGAHPEQGPLYNLLIELIADDDIADFGSWLLFLATRSDFRGTAEFILSLDTDLSPSGLKQRIDYILDHKKQKHFLRNFIFSTVPLSPRKAGLINDINNLDPWETVAYINAYPSIRVPTMIIESPDDTSGFYPEAVFVSQQISGAQLLSVGGTGHFIWLGERTKQWESALNYFLKKNQP